MVGALEPLPVGQHPLALRMASFCLPAARNAEARLARAAMVSGWSSPVHPLLIRQRPLELSDRLLGLPVGRVGGAQAGARAQRGRVAGAELAFGVGQQES